MKYFRRMMRDDMASLANAVALGDADVREIEELLSRVAGSIASRRKALQADDIAEARVVIDRALSWLANYTALDAGQDSGIEGTKAPQGRVEGSLEA